MPEGKHFSEVKTQGWSDSGSRRGPSVRQLHCRPFHRKLPPYMGVTGYCICSYMLQLCYVSMATRTSRSPPPPLFLVFCLTHTDTHLLSRLLVSDSVWLTLITFSPKFSSHQPPQLSLFTPAVSLPYCFCPPQLNTKHMSACDGLSSIWNMK